MKETLIAYLEKEPLARERANKDRACVNLLLRKYPYLKEHKDVLIAFVGEYNSMDRLWRKILEENEHLRGADYDQKTILEEKKQLDLGYRPGHEADIKLMKKIVKEWDSDIIKEQ